LLISLTYSSLYKKELPFYDLSSKIYNPKL
jgi:hypothetical protein